MGSQHETELIYSPHSNPIGVSVNSIKLTAERYKRKYKGNSIIKSLSSYSASTAGEKYFTNSKGQHYFYTRTGNKHLLIPTENVLKGQIHLEIKLAISYEDTRKKLSLGRLYVYMIQTLFCLYSKTKIQTGLYIQLQISM